MCIVFGLQDRKCGLVDFEIWNKWLSLLFVKYSVLYMLYRNHQTKRDFDVKSFVVFCEKEKNLMLTVATARKIMNAKLYINDTWFRQP